MKKIFFILSLLIVMIISGCQQVKGRKEADGTITFEPGEFQAWTNGYEAGVGIMIELAE